MNGKTVCNFTVAVNRRKTQQNQQPEADFFRVAAWDKLGENCQKYLAKGRKVCVTGPVSVSAYKGRDGEADQAQDGSTRASMEVKANEVEFLSPMENGGGHAAQAAQESANPDGFTPVETDQRPF